MKNPWNDFIFARSQSFEIKRCRLFSRHEPSQRLLT
jgi:hypothetical protein